MLTVKAYQSDETVTLQCSGRIVRGEETALLCEAARWHDRDVTLDLTNVEAIDAAGIGMLISLQAAGVYLRLLNPSKSVREMLAITRVDSVFEISESQPIVAC
jgi:anti-anti-sigma factor